MTMNGHTHCWHIVGTTSFNPHGPFLPAAERLPRRAMRCCHCGSHQTSQSDREVPLDTITFDDGCAPAPAVAS